MSYNTTVENVRLEIELEGEPIIELTDQQVEIVGIYPANILVEEEIKEKSSVVMSDDRIELIERYLSAHNLLYSGAEKVRQVSEERMSDMSTTTYVGRFDRESLRATTAGQKALAYDKSNVLEDMDKPRPLFLVPDSRGTKQKHTYDRAGWRGHYSWKTK